MNTNMSIHYSSKTEMWETPQDLFDRLNSEYKFTLDVCAIAENAKCKRFYTPEVDGLKQDWSDNICWMNPPYGREISKWVKKAYEATKPDWQHMGAKVVCLLPSRTDTRWWHDYCMKGDITFIKGRLKFIKRGLPSWREDGNFKVSPAPFPSAIVIFKPKNNPERSI